MITNPDTSSTWITREVFNPMGRVTTPVKIENLKDIFAAQDGKLSGDQIRTIAVDDALVDTGAASLSLPTSLIQQLGLTKVRTRRIITSKGVAEADVYSAVRLTIQGRDCTLDVLEVPDGVPVLVGQIPLESLDFVVDVVNQRLIGNPEHGGDFIVEMY
jgi:predicted aspartyl protease